MLRQILVKDNNKKALSEIVSYVILISITIALSIGVFAWLKLYANIEPTPDCDEATSIIMLENPRCYSEDGIGQMDIKLKNNGRFNISGIIFGVADDVKKAPIYYLVPKSDVGTLTDSGYYFNKQLSPGEIIDLNFSNRARISGTEKIFDYIKVIQIQAFVKMDNKRVVCRNSVIKQNTENCNFA